MPDQPSLAQIVAALDEQDLRDVLAAFEALPDDFPDFIIEGPMGFQGGNAERDELKATIEARNLATLRDVLEPVFGGRVLPRVRRIGDADPADFEVKERRDA